MSRAGALAGLLSLLVILVGPIQAGAADAAKVLTWDDLIPPGPPIKNVLHGLDEDQQAEVEMLAAIRLQQKAGGVDTSNPLYSDGIEIAAKLRSEGIVVENVLADYAKMKAEIDKRDAQVVTSLDGQTVRLPGYVLPLQFDGTSVEEFLLVPYVGACIHVPPPPVNQMVFVRLNQSFAPKTLYEPVWVTGRMSVKSTTKALTWVDGTADMHAGYTLSGIRVEPYKE